MKTFDTFKTSQEHCSGMFEPQQRTHLKMKKSDEEHCLNMIMKPEFVSNLRVL